MEVVRGVLRGTALLSKETDQQRHDLRAGRTPERVQRVGARYSDVLWVCIGKMRNEGTRHSRRYYVHRVGRLSQD